MARPSAFQQPDLVRVWDRVAETYTGIDVTAPDHRAYQEQFLALIGPPAGRAICEVGCGSGTTSAILGGLGARITLVDLSPRSLSVARSNFERLELRADYCRQDGLRMGFRDGAFDVVWNGGVIEHFSDEGKAALIREMWRVTRIDGLLVIMVPNAWDLPFMLGKKMAQWRGKWIFGFEDDLTSGRMRGLAARAGIPAVEFQAHNPVVGWWFLPLGRSVTRRLGLDTLRWHAMRSRCGHVLTMVARKASR